MSWSTQSDAVGWTYSTSAVCAIIEVGRYSSLWHFANIDYSQLGLVYCVISLAFQDTYRADGVDISDFKPFSGLGSLRYYSSTSFERPSLRDKSLMVFQKR